MCLTVTENNLSPQEKVESALEQMMGRSDTSLLGLFQRYNISDECKGSFALLLNALSEYEVWAIKMIDSSSKIPEGVMYGTINSFGQYDECLDIVVHEVPNDLSTQVQFKGQYCAINIHPKRPFSFDPHYLAQELPKAKIFRKMINMFTPAELSIALQVAQNRFGYCLPSTCSRYDAQAITKLINDQVHTNMSVAWCETKELIEQLDPVHLTIVFFISSLVLISLIISYIDYSSPKYFSSSSSRVKRLIQCFSISKSYEKFTCTRKLDDRFSFIYGIRFITHLWVMYANTYAIQNFMSVGNTVKLRKIPQEFLFQIFINGTLAAETFFFMSGFVVAIFMCRSLDESSVQTFSQVSFTSHMSGQNFICKSNIIKCKLFMINWFRYVLKLYSIRVWRETPIIFLTILIAILWPLAGSGPIWTETITFFSNNCRQSWPSTLFFYSNYVQPEEMCLLHSWYTSLDFQLYLVAPFLIYLLLKKTRYGMTLACVIITIAIFGICSETVVHNYPPVPIFSIQSVDYARIVKDWVYKLFFRPMLHMPSYVIGILTAYHLHDRTLQVPSIFIISGTIISTAMKFIILFAVYPWNKGESVPSVTMSSIYAGFSRPLWSLSLTIDVICGTSNGSGLLTTLLSWNFFQPLARLTFVAYMMHPLIMMATAATNRAPYAFTHFLMFQRFMSFVLMSYCVAFIIHLTLERPLIEVGRIFFNLGHESSDTILNNDHKSATSIDKMCRKNENCDNIVHPVDNCKQSLSNKKNESIGDRLTPISSTVTHDPRECNLPLTPINSTESKTSILE